MKPPVRKTYTSKRNAQAIESKASKESKHASTSFLVTTDGKSPTNKVSDNKRNPTSRELRVLSRTLKKESSVDVLKVAPVPITTDDEDEVDSVSPCRKRRRLSSTSSATKNGTTPEKQNPDIQKDVLLDSPPSPSKICTASSARSIGLSPCFMLQKRAILTMLKKPRISLIGQDNDTSSIFETAFEQLSEVFHGSMNRGEGNSCLLLGPRNSGKSLILDKCISSLKEQPIVIRLSGWVHHNDRLALLDIGRQINRETGVSLLPMNEDGNGANLPDDGPDPGVVSLPPSSHLHALISILPTLKRPTVVVLDAFDLFALHPRQALLYCLLDTVQSCQAGGLTKGLLVIGLTSRLDTINLLEKRVKSRFSGRIIRTSSPSRLEGWLELSKFLLTSSTLPDTVRDAQRWNAAWSESVEEFFQSKDTQQILKETFSVSREVSTLACLLTALVMRLTPQSPFPSAELLLAVAEGQNRHPEGSTKIYSYPASCLLIASVHAETRGYACVTFEMLHDFFRTQVRSSTVAPVQLNGGSIGMMNCTKELLSGAFEDLIAQGTFVNVGGSNGKTKDFGKYCCTISREHIIQAIDNLGQSNLKRWLNKGV